MPDVFGYGSLVDRGSVEATLGRPLADAPRPARLRGFRRSWCVGFHCSVRPDYRFTADDGLPWSGWLVSLGLVADPRAVTLGAVFGVTVEELAVLDRREADYDRAAVADRTTAVDGTALDEQVFTYLPTQQTRARAEELGVEACVTQRYLRLVERGYRTLGDDLYAEHLAGLPDPAPHPVRPISVAPHDPSIRNEAVDPALGNH